MNYKQEKRKFRVKQIKSTLRWLRLSRVVMWMISVLNSIDGQILRLIIVLLEVEYKIYLKLHEVSYDNRYLDRATQIKSQIDLTKMTLGG